MPLTEILCAAPKYRRNNEDFPVKINDCLDCAHTRENSCHFTYELLSSMFAQQQDRGVRISTTTLTAKCIRSEYFKRLEDYAEKPEKLWAAFRGTMYHGQLEQHAAPGSIEEARYHAETDYGHLSGSPDLVDIRMGVLYDYKVTKEVPKFSYPWEDHVAQLNVNRWLVDNADWVEWRGQAYLLNQDREQHVLEQIGEGFLNTNVRKNLALFRPVQWNELVVIYMDDKGPKPITCTKSVEVSKVGGDGTKKQRVPDIWDDKKSLAYINDKYLLAKKAFYGDAVPAIPDNFIGWEHPLCGFCPKKKECISEHFEGIND
jgi:hypothetical protein